MQSIILFCLLSLVTVSHALYGPSSDVISATDKTFKNEVLKQEGVVIVEFYAPWCGHCKSLTPEYEKAASTLKGVVKIVAVDATESQQLAQKYGIQGFPTIKIFGSDKKSPTNYQGQRTSDAIITEAMKNVNALVKSRKNGGSTKQKASSSTSSSSGSNTNKGASSSNSAGSDKSNKKGGSEVVILTDLNFDALVLESDDLWLVEFYAPWCGHCKNLAPEWEQAAKELKGQVKLGAVDATIHTSLASKYEVKGYPTIKIFGGKKKKGQDYNGPREAPGIVQYALETLDRIGVPVKINQVTNSNDFNNLCGQSGKICVLMFVPHIYDSSAKERNQYITQLGEIAKEFRGKPLVYGWTEGGAQESLEKAIEVNGGYPTIALISIERSVYNVQRVSWTDKNIKSFINGVLSGIEKNRKLDRIPVISTVPAWDGKDAVVETEEPPLDPDWLNSSD